MELGLLGLLMARVELELVLELEAGAWAWRRCRLA